MTRSEFLSGVKDFWDLRDFCLSEGSDYFDDIYDESAKDEYVDDYLQNLDRYEQWRDVLVFLEKIPDNESDWYRLDDYSGFISLDFNDFAAMKNEVLDWADEYSCWDEEPEPVEEENDDYEIGNEPISAESLLVLCRNDACEEKNSDLPSICILLGKEGE